MTVKAQVILKQVDPAGSSLVIPMYDGAPAVNADGGWNTVSRARNVGITEFQGYNPLTMDLPLILDGFSRNTSVEPTIVRLYAIMRNRVGPRREPAVLQVSGPIPFNNLRWVINNIQVQDEIRRESDGNRVRFIFTLSLLQYIPGSIIIAHKSSPAKKSKSKSTATGKQVVARYYTVRTGDTLGKIAANLLHSSTKWREIATLNGIRDPNKLKVGSKLKIPKS